MKLYTVLIAFLLPLATPSFAQEISVGGKDLVRSSDKLHGNCLTSANNSFAGKLSEVAGISGDIIQTATGAATNLLNINPLAKLESAGSATAIALKSSAATGMAVVATSQFDLDVERCNIELFGRLRAENRTGSIDVNLKDIKNLSEIQVGLLNRVMKAKAEKEGFDDQDLTKIKSLLEDAALDASELKSTVDFINERLDGHEKFVKDIKDQKDREALKADINQGAQVLTSLTNLAFSDDPITARRLSGTFVTSATIASNLIDLSSGLSDLAVAGASLNIVGAAIGLVSLFSSFDQGPSADQQILDAVLSLRDDVRSLEKTVNSRFDRLETALKQMHEIFENRFASLDQQLIVIDEKLDRVYYAMKRLIDEWRKVKIFELKRDIADVRLTCVDRIPNPVDNSDNQSARLDQDIYQKCLYHALSHANSVAQLALLTGSTNSTSEIKRSAFNILNELPETHKIGFLAAIAVNQGLEKNANWDGSLTLINDSYWFGAAKMTSELVHGLCEEYGADCQYIASHLRENLQHEFNTFSKSWRTIRAQDQFLTGTLWTWYVTQYLETAELIDQNVEALFLHKVVRGEKWRSALFRDNDEGRWTKQEKELAWSASVDWDNVRGNLWTPNCFFEIWEDVGIGYNTEQRKYERTALYPERGSSIVISSVSYYLEKQLDASGHGGDPDKHRDYAKEDCKRSNRSTQTTYHDQGDAERQLVGRVRNDFWNIRIRNMLELIHTAGHSYREVDVQTYIVRKYNAAIEEDKEAHPDIWDQLANSKNALSVLAKYLNGASGGMDGNVLSTVEMLPGTGADFNLRASASADGGRSMKSYLNHIRENEAADKNLIIPIRQADGDEALDGEEFSHWRRDDIYLSTFRSVCSWAAGC